MHSSVCLEWKNGLSLLFRAWIGKRSLSCMESDIGEATGQDLRRGRQLRRERERMLALIFFKHLIIFFPA